MTPRKHISPDAITQGQAATILGQSIGRVQGLIKSGVLTRTPNRQRSLSRSQVEDQLANPKQPEWINAQAASAILGISKTRTGQLADKGFLPFDVGHSGSRRYRRQQIEIISRARQIRWHPMPKDEQRTDPPDS